MCFRNKGKKYQYGLGTLCLLVALAAVISTYVRIRLREREAVRRIAQWECVLTCEDRRDGLTRYCEITIDWQCPRIGAELREIRPWAERYSCVSLNLCGTALDDDVIAGIAAFHNLTRLYLAETNIDDATMARLGLDTCLESVFLAGTQVTDKTVDLLIQMPQLNRCDLSYTDVTDAGIERLRDHGVEVTIWGRGFSIWAAPL